MKVKELFEITNWQKEQLAKLPLIDLSAHYELYTRGSVASAPLPKVLAQLIQFVESVKKDCAPYIKEMQKFDRPRMMLRGMGEHSHTPLYVEFGSRKTPKNRQPRDAKMSITKIVDKIFQRLFGIKFRTNYVFFASGSGDVAADYGAPAYVFPKGDFKILWSPEIDDFVTIQELIDELEGDEEKISKYLKNNYQTGNLNSALKSGNEIMVYAPKGYHYMSVDEFNETIQKIMSLEDEGVADIQKTLSNLYEEEVLFYAITGQQK